MSDKELEMSTGWLDEQTAEQQNLNRHNQDLEARKRQQHAKQQHRRQHRKNQRREQLSRERTIALKKDIESLLPPYITDWNNRLTHPEPETTLESIRKNILRKNNWVGKRRQHTIDEEKTTLATVKKLAASVSRPLPPHIIIALATTGDSDHKTSILSTVATTLSNNRPLSPISVIDLSTRTHPIDGFTLSSRDYLSHLSLIHMDDSGLTHDGFFPPITRNSNLFWCPGGPVAPEPDSIRYYCHMVRNGVINHGITLIHVPLDETPGIIDAVAESTDSIIFAPDNTGDGIARTITLATSLSQSPRISPALANSLTGGLFILQDGTRGNKKQLESLRPGAHVVTIDSGDEWDNVDTLVPVLTQLSRAVKGVASLLPAHLPLPHTTVRFPDTIGLSQEQQLSADVDARYQQQIMIKGERTILPPGVMSIIGHAPIHTGVDVDTHAATKINNRIREKDAVAKRNAIVASILIVAIGTIIAVATVIGTTLLSTLDDDRPHGPRDTNTGDQPVNITRIEGENGEENTVTGMSRSQVDIPRGGHVITYRVTSSGGIRAASVTYLDGDTRQQSETGISIPWETSLGFYPESTPALSVATTGTGTITCIIQKNGTTIHQESESGSNPSIQCGG